MKGHAAGAMHCVLVGLLRGGAEQVLDVQRICPAPFLDFSGADSPLALPAMPTLFVGRPTMGTMLPVRTIGKCEHAPAHDPPCRRSFEGRHPFTRQPFLPAADLDKPGARQEFLGCPFREQSHSVVDPMQRH
jgi:hypothetical protein